MLNKLIAFALLLIVSISFAADYDLKKLRKERAVAAHRQRRIILNNDGNDKPGKIVTPETFLASRTSGLEDTQVDSIFYCTGVFNLYTHFSNESEIFDTEKKLWAKELIKQGNDSLTLMTQWCHQNDKEIIWSMRMNDTHDAGIEELLSEWKTEHSEYMIGKKGDFFPHGNFRWTSLNYALKPVRDKVLAILTDVCSRYDVDGIELDFFRHPIYFEGTMQGLEATDAQRSMMTSLIKQIREMTEQKGLQRGRPILVSIRVPDSLGYCAALGLDVQQWLDEGLFDMFSVGDYFKLEPWENTVTLGKKYNVPVYACLESRRLVPEERRSDAEHVLKVFRGEAYNALEAGVDGIYLFNVFDPKNSMLNELGDKDILKILERIDQTAYFQIMWSTPEVWLATASKYFKGKDNFDDPATIVNENLIPFRERLKFKYNRNLIYNNDGYENLTKVEITPQNFLDARTTGIENTQVKSIFYCTGLTTAFTHNTKVAGRFGYGGISDERKNFPLELDKFNTDSLALQVEYARKHHKEIFWSMRMNDTHDSSMKSNALRTEWKLKHPECLMGSPGESFPYGGSRWSALDYSKPLVRKFIFDVIEEVCRNYDVDGIELDFFRHPVYFKEVMLGNDASPRSLQYMTRLIEDIRRMTEEVSASRGRPLLIAIHIPDSLGYCKAIGLDVQTWLENDLVDILVGAGYFQLQPWKEFVQIGKQYNVPVYACYEGRRIVPADKTGDDDYFIKRFRGAALDAWNQGINGIYTFNLWYSQDSPFAVLFDGLGRPDLLRTLERIGEASYVQDLVFPPEKWLKDGRRYLNDESTE